MTRRRGCSQIASFATLLGMVLMTCAVGVSSAAAPTPAFSIRSIAWPTNFQAGSEGRDKYTLLVENIGGAESKGTITVTDTLPAGITGDEVVAKNPLWECAEEASKTKVTCTKATLESLMEESLVIPVNVVSGSREVLNVATIEEAGGAPAVVTSEPSTTPNTVEAAVPAFAIRNFDFSAFGLDGQLDEQAGDHPTALTVAFDFNLPVSAHPGAENNEYFQSSEEVKDVIVDLPPGQVGDPLASARCSLAEMARSSGQEFGCRASSRVGTLSRLLLGDGEEELGLPIFNVVPESGYPAELGVWDPALDKWIMLYANVVHSDSDAGGYGLRVRIPSILRAANLGGSSATFFGDPAAYNGSDTTPGAFFSNPTACSTQPINARVEADSWQKPGVYASQETELYPHVTGCEMLQFHPTVAAAPETTQADTPSGYEVDVKIPQAPSLAPILATPDLKDATVTLPEGVAVSPSAANGLVGCSESGANGIDFPGGEHRPDEAGEGEEIGVDGFSRLAKGHCPAASKIGIVEVETPLLPPRTLTGYVYLAQPRCGGGGQPACSEASATNGELYGIYLEIEGAGVIVKLRGKVEADPGTGQLTTRFEENPQIPFSELRLHLNGGQRAPLANPQSCGTFTATSDLVPWSAPETPDATPSSSFAVTGCAGDPFAPSFSSGTEQTLAGAFSPFTLTFSRHDGEQELSALTVTTPPGLLGEIAGVQQCPEPQASRGECGPGSLIGHTEVAAGAGSEPFWVGGSVYLTGPYKGAPFGLSVVTPAVAGPFNLGNVIVRAAIRVNPSTSALTVTSDPLPQIIDGVPLRIQTVNVTIDRAGFMFNPTSCDQQQVAATITSAQGAVVPVSSPFAVAGCANLPFKPTLTVSTSGKTSKEDGASLTVKVAQKPGEANIHKVDLTIPLALPARLKTLNKACLAATFEANPAGCPEASVIGTATAHTPVLQAPLTGPAYLVSHGGAAFPDVEFVLQANERGGNVEIVLDGGTDIKKGITYSRFETVPDAPISSFETTLPEGPHSVLTANVNLCKPTKTVTVKKRVAVRRNGRTMHVLRAVKQQVPEPLVIPTTIVGQNGAQVSQSTKVAVSGCPKVGVKKAKPKR